MNCEEGCSPQNLCRPGKGKVACSHITELYTSKQQRTGEEKKSVKTELCKQRKVQDRKREKKRKGRKRGGRRKKKGGKGWGEGETEVKVGGEGESGRKVCVCVCVRVYVSVCARQKETRMTESEWEREWEWNRDGETRREKTWSVSWLHSGLSHCVCSMATVTQSRPTHFMFITTKVAQAGGKSSLFMLTKDLTRKPDECVRGWIQCHTCSLNTERRGAAILTFYYPWLFDIAILKTKNCKVRRHF